MKNITLSIDEDLIKTGREYAQQHQTTLNQLMRDLLKQKVAPSKERSLKELFDLFDQNPSPVTDYKYCREDAYDV